MNLSDLLPTESDSAIAIFILQYSRSITALDRESIKRNFQVFGYLPDDAMVVRASYVQLREFQNRHPEIFSITRYAPILKVNPDLLNSSRNSVGHEIHITLRLFNQKDGQKVAEEIRILFPHVKVENITGRYLNLEAFPRDVLSIAAFTEIEHIEESPEFRILQLSGAEPAVEYSQLTGFEDGTRLMGFQSAWSLGFYGQNQILGMADTGVDSGDLYDLVPDLQGAILAGQVFGKGSKSWADPMGHGTHIAGLMVGRGLSSQGTIRGGAYGASLIAGGMWSPKDKNLTIPTRLSDLFARAYYAGAKVYSNSWGSNKDLGAYTSTSAQVDEWMFEHPDMLLVFAAGNNGVDKNKDGRIDPASIATPATAKNCLTVGAAKNFVAQGGIQGAIGKLRGGSGLWPVEPLYSSGMSDSLTGLAPFSSRGPTLDGRIKPDVLASGSNILGVKSHQEGASSLWAYFNENYTWSGGTSMAAPLAAAAAALTRQILIEKWGLQNPSAAMIKAFLIHSAEDLFPGQFGAIGELSGQELVSPRPNNDEGYGRINLDQLVKLGGGTFVIDHTQGLGQDEELEYLVDAPTASNLSINLVWTDAPASPNASVALVNDLDIEVIDEQGERLNTQDHLNNSESVELKGLTKGLYKIKIRGFRVPEGGAKGKQPFALIYTLGSN